MVENDTKFVVEEDDVQRHAPIVFECMRLHYKRLTDLGDIVPDAKYIERTISETVANFGVLPEGDIKYEPSLLDNEQFRLTVIFHMCISTWLGSDIEWESYVSYLDLLEKTVSSSEDNRPEPLTPQSILLKLFSVSPKVLPKGYLQLSSVFDEINRATTIIDDEVSITKPANEGFINYEAYFEYMRGEATRITNMLHGMGMFGTHELDRFTMLLIAARNGMPAFDILYTNPRISRPVMPGKMIKALQMKILEASIGLEPGEYEGGDIDEDD